VVQKIRCFNNKGDKMKHRKILSNILATAIFLLTIFMSGTVYAVNEDEFSATLVEYGGDVFLQKPGEEDWLPIDNDIAIEEGDRIKTGNDSFAEILMDDGSLIRLDEDSSTTVTELSVDSEGKKISSRLFLWVGRILSNVAGFKHRKSKFEVYTKTAVAGVRGTEFVIEAMNSGQTDVGVFDGEVDVGGVDKEGNLLRRSKILITRDRQTSVFKNQRPLKPFALKKEMKGQKKKIEALRKKGADRRRNLKNIIKKRKKAQEKILKKWKKLKRKPIIKKAKPGIKIKDQKPKRLKRKVKRKK